MSRTVSRAAIVGALLKKELTAYSRDLAFLGLTLVVLVAVPFVFHALPDSVDESITLAVYPSIDEMIGEAKGTLIEMGVTEEQLAELDGLDLAAEEEGLTVVELENEERLRGVIEGSLELCTRPRAARLGNVDDGDSAITAAVLDHRACMAGLRDGTRTLRGVEGARGGRGHHRHARRGGMVARQAHAGPDGRAIALDQPRMRGGRNGPMHIQR